MFALPAQVGWIGSHIGDRRFRGCAQRGLADPDEWHHAMYYIHCFVLDGIKGWDKAHGIPAFSPFYFLVVVV